MEIIAKEKARAARNAYARKWRKNNPDKVRANNERYWIRRAEREAAEAAEKEAKGEICDE